MKNSSLQSSIIFIIETEKKATLTSLDKPFIIAISFKKCSKNSFNLPETNFSKAVAKKSHLFLKITSKRKTRGSLSIIFPD